MHEETSRRERKKEETRHRIFHAAIDLFRERGFEQTTVDDITEKADVAKGTFFNYFPRKEAVLDYLSEERLGVIEENVASLFAEDRDAREKLIEVYEMAAAAYEEDQELARFVLVELMRRAFGPNEELAVALARDHRGAPAPGPGARRAARRPPLRARRGAAHRRLLLHAVPVGLLPGRHRPPAPPLLRAAGGAAGPPDPADGGLRVMNRLLPWASLLLAAALLSPAPGAGPPGRSPPPAPTDTLRLTLDDAVQRALPRSEDMRTARANVKQTSGQVFQAASQALPQVSGTRRSTTGRSRASTTASPPRPPTAAATT